MAGVDRIRIANNEWRSFQQHNRYRDGNMKHQHDKDQQTQSGKPERNNNLDEDQNHVDEYV